MSSAAAESVLQKWFRRVWDQGDVAAIEELAAPDVLSHGLLGDIRGRDAWRQRFYEPMRAMFSDVKVEVLDEVTTGDKTFAKLKARVTARAMPSKPLVLEGSCMLRCQDGRIVEGWDSWKFHSLLEALRFLPLGALERALLKQLQGQPTSQEEPGPEPLP